MAYQVIARKYRPQRFEEVVGQEHVTRTLSNAIIQNRIAHAYLFVGPRGTGKTTIARIFAKCLNCTDGPRVDFSDEDPRCIEISEGRSLDVLEIDGASNRGIDEIRELRDTAAYAPANGRFKIYIIDEIHMLTREAFNALLKTLEEPPPHVKFMFATTEPEKVLTTILSRCQRFDLKRIPVKLIVNQLEFICGNEGVQAEREALEAIARGSEGCLRDAESTLDQLISFCGDKIKEEDVLSAFGLTSRAEIQKLTGAILDNDLGEALKSLHILMDNGKDIARLNSDLLMHFRNLALFQISKGNRSLTEVSDSEWACIEAQSTKVSLEGLSRIMDILVGNEWKLSSAASRSVVMELSLMEVFKAKDALSLDVLLQKLEHLKKSSTASSGRDSSVPAKAQPSFSQKAPNIECATRPQTPTPAVSPAANQPQRSEPIPASRPMSPYAGLARSQKPAEVAVISQPESKPYPKDLKAFWGELLGYIKNLDLFLYGVLRGCVLTSFKGGVLEVGLPVQDTGLQLVLDTPEKKKIFQDYLASCGYPNCRVVFEASALAKMVEPEPHAEQQVAVEESQAGVQPQKEPPITKLTEVSKPPPFEEIDFKNDPLIKKALEVFQATIVQKGMDPKK
ncbi:MAG: DNA polymerase III subunit gamma/tau [Verrucomicrobiae bacterium]|nr:DNA polymerase III subunit gamma/tau [Verrucomicrobiae bacterium]